MLMRITISVALASFAVIPAQAGELACMMKYTNGSVAAWTFANNTSRTPGSVGSIVETGYKSTSGSAFYPPGSRPVWLWQPNNYGSYNLIQQNDSSYQIVTFPGSNGGTSAFMLHNGVVLGKGACSFHIENEDVIPDVAPGD